MLPKDLQFANTRGLDEKGGREILSAGSCQPNQLLFSIHPIFHRPDVGDPLIPTVPLSRTHNDSCG